MSDSKDYKIYLKDIKKSIEKIESYVKGFDYKKFKENELVVDGVIRNLAIIGEAVKNLPLDFREENKEIEWKKIIGFRDVLIHSYSGVDLEIVWDVVKNKLSELRKIIELDLR